MGINVLSFPELVFFDKVDSPLWEVTALDFEWRHTIVFDEWPESVTYTAPQVKQHYRLLLTTVRAFSFFKFIAELSELPRQIVPVFVKLRRVLLIKYVPVASSIELQSLNSHLGQFRYTLIWDDLLSISRPLFIPLIISDLTVYLPSGCMLLRFLDFRCWTSSIFD